MGSHGRTGKSRPEAESSQIPLIIRYPGLIPAGKVSEALISCVDMMPTLLAMIGAPVPAYAEGTDLSAAVMGLQENGTDTVLLQYEKSYWADNPKETYRALVKGGWSYTYYLVDGPMQLFNLKEDPYQINNLIDD